MEQTFKNYANGAAIRGVVEENALGGNEGAGNDKEKQARSQIKQKVRPRGNVFIEVPVTA